MEADGVVAVVMAGGEGLRLRPLTAEQPKPALPVAGTLRLIDFVLANLWNSGIRRVFVLLQYKPAALLEHLERCWGAGSVRRDRGFIEPVLPDPARPFAGTADAVRQAMPRLDSHRAQAVAVFAADHVYRMDVRQMLEAHARSQADATVAARPVPLECARAFGVLATDRRGRIVAFEEKPSRPQPMPDDAGLALASMGNYLFRPSVLQRALAATARRGGHDFGRDVLPWLIDTHRVQAYDFRNNVVPGLAPYEEAAYWRDVGTPEALTQVRFDLAGDRPRLALHNPRWPWQPLATPWPVRSAWALGAAA